MELETIFATYKGVMREEIRLRIANEHPVINEGVAFPIVERPDEMYLICWRILENARSEFVSRSYNTRYNLTTDDVVYESVAAHSNLMNVLVTSALDYYYGNKWFGSGEGVQETVDGYTYREVIEATRLHDLPENEMGDIPDNGDRDENEKNYREFRYFAQYLETFDAKNLHFKNRVNELLRHMYRQDSSTGRLLYLADKVSALIVTLCMDFYIKSPMIYCDSPFASERDRYEMTNCDYRYGEGYYRASEMWAMDFLQIRKQNELDDTLFFTGVIVMTTLAVNGQWYNWRSRDYKKKTSIEII